MSLLIVLGMGIRNGWRSLNLKVVRDILLAWILTLPIAGVLGASSYWFLDKVF